MGTKYSWTTPDGLTRYGGPRTPETNAGEKAVDREITISAPVLGAWNLGSVGTHTYIPDALHPSNTQAYTRTPHVVQDDITGIMFVYPAFTASPGSGEVLQTVGATWTAALEYPLGTITQMKFNGGSAVGVTSGDALLFTDMLPVSIPRGSVICARQRVVAGGSAKVAYQQYYSADGTLAQAVFGTSVADSTMGGNVAVQSAATQQAYVGPCMILAMTRRGSVAIMGDSVALGRGDRGDAGLKQGYFERAFAGGMSCANLSISGDTLVAFNGSSVTRRRLAGYCTGVVTNIGINDVTGGRSAAQVLTDMNAFIASVNPTGTKPVGLATLTMVTTSTDSWATTTNQTTVASEAVRMVVNAQRRNGLAGASALFDVERAIESAPGSGLWSVLSGSITPATPSTTDDGTHPNRTGFLAAVRAVQPLALMS